MARIIGLELGSEVACHLISARAPPDGDIELRPLSAITGALAETADLLVKQLLWRRLLICLKALDDRIEHRRHEEDLLVRVEVSVGARLRLSTRATLRDMIRARLRVREGGRDRLGVDDGGREHENVRELVVQVLFVVEGE